MLTNSKEGHVQRNKKVKLYYCKNFTKPIADEPVLIFNYGLVCSNSHWQYQIPFFEKLGYKILIHDYRGHFTSTCNEPLESLTFKNITDDLAAIMEKNKINQAIMFGHSMGVNVTLEFAKRFPDKISGMVLIAGTVLPVTEVMFDSNIMEVVAPALQKMMYTFPEFSKWSWKNMQYWPLWNFIIKQEGFNAQKASNEFIATYINNIGKLSHELFFQMFFEMARHKIKKDLRKIKTPSLVVAGDKDKVIPYTVQLYLHQKLKNSELYIIKNGSHVPQVDFPEFLNERMKLFLEQIQIAN